MAHVYVQDIKAGQAIDGIYLVKEAILRSTTGNALYIAMYVCDRTGQLNGRMWQATEAAYNSLPKPGFVRIIGRSELYQNNLQIIINKFEVVEPDKVNLDDFLARTEKNVAKMFAEVKSCLEKIKNPQVKALVAAFLEDKELMAMFCKSPAAVKMHHNYLGGLLEHTHGMLMVAAAILGFYPKINADLVLAGVFLHDMGKTDELCCDMTFGYTDSGQLIGHISKSFLMLNQKAERLEAKGVIIDKELLDALGHIILAHHGEYEFGSPKLPATGEAFMVNYIDDLDAKMNQVTSLIEQEQGDSNWTAWQTALQTRLYRKQVLPDTKNQ